MKKNTKTLFGIVFAITLGVILFATILNQNRNKLNIILNDEVQLEYGVDYSQKELIEKFVNISDTVIPQSYTIDIKDVDTKKNLATQMAKVDVVNDQGVVKKSYDTLYALVDNEAPSITGTFKYVITAGDELVLDIVVTDNYDQDIEYTFEKTIDTDKVGTFKTSVSATDSSNNKSKQEIDVIIEPKKVIAVEAPKQTVPPKAADSSGNEGASTNTSTKPPSGTSGSTQKPSVPNKPNPPSTPKRTWWLLNGEKFHAYCEDWGTQYNCGRLDDSPLASNMDFIFSNKGEGLKICKETLGCKIFAGTAQETQEMIKNTVTIYE